MADPAWRKRYRWLFMPLSLLALAAVVVMLWDAWPALRANLPRLKAGWLVLVLAGNLCSAYLAFEAFRCLFERIRGGAYGRLTLARFYFVGQLLKHLPGRVWGLAYQSTLGRRASVAEWVGVTVAYTVLGIAFALWTAASVVGFAIALPWGVMAVAGGAAVYALVWHARLLSAVLAAMRRLPLPAVEHLYDALQPFVAVDAGFKARLLGWFCTSWLLYLLAWAGYGLAWPGLTALDGVKLCALYTLAWFFGYISLVSPSGVGVRELVFVLIAKDFPPDAVAGMAVLGRVVLLLVDVTLACAFAPFNRTKA